MKKRFLLFALVLTICSTAMAQTESKYYVNVEFKDGTVRSYSAEVTSRVTFGEKKEVGTINGHAYVELAGYKWATENVGSVENGITARAFDPTYGLYYTQKVDDVEYAKQAAESWGGTWKLPTEEQWNALLDENNCTWEWQASYSFNGKTMSGYKVSDKADSSKFIFLPAAGFYDVDSDGNGNVGGQGGLGYYWSSGYARYLGFYYDVIRRMYNSGPNEGLSVRPVSY